MAFIEITNFYSVGDNENRNNCSLTEYNGIKKGQPPSFLISCLMIGHSLALFG